MRPEAAGQPGETRSGSEENMLAVLAVRYGEDAFGVLARLIAEAKADDLLAPVHVVVDRGTLGLALRRRLASNLGPNGSRLGAGQGQQGGRGVANVSFGTLGRLASEIAGGALARSGRVELSDVALCSAVRAELGSRTTGPFSRLGSHAGTVRALARTFTELRMLPPAVLEPLAMRGPRQGEIVDILHGIRGRLEAGYFDEADLLRGATAILSSGQPDLPAGAGAVIVYLPSRLREPARSFLSALSLTRDVTVILGTTGDDAADEEVRHLARQFGSIPLSTGRSSASHGGIELVGGEHAGTLVVRAPSADVEVEAALRSVMRRSAEGTPLEAMAIAYPTPEPYGRLLRDALGRAGIPFNGPEARSLASTVTGRFLIGMLDLVLRDWRRGALVDWFSCAPVLTRGLPVPATSWDWISAEAGVVSGIGQWRDRLQSFCAAREATLRMAEDEAEGECADGRAGILRMDISNAEALSDFVEELARRLSEMPGSWEGFAQWARDLLRDYLGTELERSDWPDEEAEAFNAVIEMLGALGSLDGLEPMPPYDGLLAILASSLDSRAPQASRFGRGVYVCGVEELRGLYFDCVHLVGMHDGGITHSGAEDPLLPDRLRIGVHDELAVRSARSSERRRDYLAALAAAPERVLSFAEVDQRRGRSQRPSRWWLDALEAVSGVGRTLWSRDLDQVEASDSYIVLRSSVDALRRFGEPIDLREGDLRSLLKWTEEERDLAKHPLTGSCEDLSGSIKARRARRSHALTAFDGKIEDVDIPSPAEGRVLSPTGLESYATCPRQYFFSHLLGLQVRENPDEINRLGAQDRGRLIHEILERFIGERIEPMDREPLAPDRGWTEADLVKLESIADEILVRYERQGLLGSEVFREIDRAGIMRDLESFLQSDAEHRVRLRATPVAVELRFGMEGSARVSLPLAGGRHVNIRGKVDRIDRSEDGALVVIDYKTGRPTGWDIDDQDPTAAGTRLQLPLYAEVAAHLLADDRKAHSARSPVRSLYWFVSERGSLKQLWIDVDDDCRRRTGEVVDLIVSGIESGLFPGNSGVESVNCKHCPFDVVCPSDREAQWDAKCHDSTLTPYLSLSETQGAR